jgi:hypothetical protein
MFFWENLAMGFLHCDKLFLNAESVKIGFHRGLGDENNGRSRVERPGAPDIGQLRSHIVVVAFLLRRVPALLLHFVRSLPGVDDDPEPAHRLRIRRHHRERADGV